MKKISKKTLIFLGLALLIMALSAVVSVAVNTFEHNSSYDVSEYVYEDLDDFTDSHHYYHDSSLDPGNGGNATDAVVGTLDGNKIIDLYYAYDNQITIKYYDAYTNLELSGSDYLADKSGYTITQEHTTSYDITNLINKVYSGYAFVKNVEYSDAGLTASGTLLSDFDVSVYLGKTYSITVNYHDTFNGNAIKDSFVLNEVEQGGSYNIAEKQLATIEHNSINYKLDYVKVNGVQNDSYAFSGNMGEENLVIDIYYYYTHSVTIKFVDKYTGATINKNTIVFDETTPGFNSRHGASYDVSAHVDETQVLSSVLRNETETYDFIGSIYGDLTGTLDSDKTIVVSLGYYHTITVRYRDKYTGAIIHTEEISIDEAGSKYNLNYASAPNIVCEETTYNYDGHDGDELEGVLDEDKEATLYYGYNNLVSVIFKDLETEDEIIERDIVSMEHLSNYETSEKTETQIAGYNNLSKVTGDNVSGSLDEDKEITVWYSKASQEKSPETSDLETKKMVVTGVITAILIIFLMCMFIAEAIRKKREKR